MLQVVPLCAALQTRWPRPWQAPIPLSTHDCAAGAVRAPPTVSGVRPTAGYASSNQPSQSLSLPSHSVSLPMIWFTPESCTSVTQVCPDGHCALVLHSVLVLPEQ